ncbi:MAG: dihydrodipicolinate synthase family protein, partial [Pseudomonadota bacterium]
RGRLVRLAVDQAEGRVPVTVGCSAPTLAAAESYARAGIENGAAALLSMPPTYVLKGSRAEILARYEALGRLGAPVIAYNSPRRHGYSLSLDDVAAIRGACDLIGIKESNRDFFHHTHMLAAFADEIAVMTGPCHYIVPSLPLGAAGFIATGPEFLGAEAGRIVRHAMAGPSEAARRLHWQLTCLYEALMGTGTWPAAFKAGLGLIGWPAGVPRDPVLPLDADGVDRLRRLFDEVGIATA